VVRASNVYSALAVFVLFLPELFIVWVGCKARVNTDEVDRFQLDDVHFCFVYQSTALDESDFLKAIYLEIKTDNIEEMKQKILAFGVKKLDVPDPHLYFQAPGVQVFKLVGINEDLSLSEGSASSRPGASASASEVGERERWR